MINWKIYRPKTDFAPSQKRLEHLNDSIVKKLPKIEYFGKGSKDSADFSSYSQKVFRLYLDSTNEKQILTDFLINKMIPGLSSNTSYLSVGAGDGKVDLPIIKKADFSNATLIEPNKNLNSKLRRDCKRITNCNFKITQKSMLDFNFSNTKNDLILFSHVLYYTPAEKWFDLAKKAYDSLNKDGMLIFVMNSQYSKAMSMLREELGLRFSPYFYELIDALEKNIPTDNIEYHKYTANHFSNTKKGMAYLLSINLEVSDSKIYFTEVKDICDTYLKANDNLYIFEKQDEIVVLKKE